MDSVLIPNLIKKEDNNQNPQVETKPDFIVNDNNNSLENNQNVSTNMPNQQNPNPNNSIRNKKILMWTFGVLGVLLVLLIYVGVNGFFIYQNAMSLKNDAKVLVEKAKSGDINGVKADLPKLRSGLTSLKRKYTLIAWTKYVPYFGNYVADMGHSINAGINGIDTAVIVVETIEPYADIFGLEAESGEKTMQERIDFVVKTIPDILPKIDSIAQKMKLIKEDIDEIDADRYPKEFKGIKISENITLAQDLINEAYLFTNEGRPVLESAPWLLGMDSPRRYLILFQNDKELRPTGGFMTAYTIMKVDQAKFEPVSSDDIYNLDAKYKPSIKAPEPIIDMIKGPYILSQNLRLRDMNWSPDYEESMKMVDVAIKEVGITDIDGIISVDTHLLTNLLGVIGPIGVPGFGNFSNDIDPKCNCPQVIYELESFADVEGPIIWDPLTGEIILKPKNADNRKKIIGPLMNSILANALGQPKEKLPLLFEAGFKSLLEKHVLFYIYDEKIQKGLSDFGLASKVEEYKGDYLHISDANLGGRKSNLYVTQEVHQDIEVGRDGSVVKTVTITYNNPAKHDGWLNSVLPNWVRVYVPKGSELVAAEGLESKAEPYEDLGKTVYAGMFSLRPEGVAKVTLKYKLPMKFNKEYSLLIQKQPGTDAPLYTTTLGKHEEEVLLNTDKEIKIKI